MLEKKLKIDYLPLDLLYKLQDLTGCRIMFDDYIDTAELSEAIRALIERS